MKIFRSLFAKQQPLVMNILKNEILNDEMIGKVADLILSSAKSAKGDQEDLAKKELASVQTKIDNILKAIESGIMNESVTERLADLEKEKKVLETKISLFKPSVSVTRDQLIKQLHEDAKVLWEGRDTAAIRDVLKEYIVRIDVGDDEITIHAVNDLAEKEQTAGNESDGLNTSGCGGWI